MSDYAIEKAKRLLDEAMNPKGMHTNGPTYVRIEASLLNRLLTLAAQGERQPDLHMAIMNIPCNPPNFEPNRRAYREGHRDARHAAAELVVTNRA